MTNRSQKYILQPEILKLIKKGNEETMMKAFVSVITNVILVIFNFSVLWVLLKRKSILIK
jgi:hypothetical protein